jgi:hypothetical protein
MTRENGYLAFYLALFCISIFPLVFPPIVYADDYSFDLEAFEKKPLQWGGYLELKWEHMNLNRDGAFYLLNSYEDPRETLNRFATTLQFDGSFQMEKISANWVMQANAWQDEEERDKTADVFEAFVSLKPTPLATFNLGKKTYRWGKGYAWNPASVVDRPKDPNNPEEALEGFAGAELDLVKSFSGSLQTVALTTVFIPVTKGWNDDFGRDAGGNFAAKLYLLYKDTDIDLIWFEGHSRPTKYGIDFAKNLATNFEIHGELIHVPEQEKKVLSSDGTIDTREIAATSYLLGFRFLTESDLTTIIEFYHNDDGYTEAEMDRFFQLFDDAYDVFDTTGNNTLLRKAQRLSTGGYGKPQAWRNYLYIKTTQKDPFGLLYTTPGFIAIINTKDKSYSMSPEITYTGFTNWEYRLRLTLLQGGNATEYGEKPNEYKAELKVRYFF